LGCKDEWARDHPSVRFAPDRILFGDWGWWFRVGLLFKAHRLLYHPTLGVGVIKKKKYGVEGASASSSSLQSNPLGVWGLGFGVWGLGFGVWGLGFEVWGLGLRVEGSGFEFAAVSGVGR